jgi:hypothetical protein
MTTKTTIGVVVVQARVKTKENTKGGGITTGNTAGNVINTIQVKPPLVTLNVAAIAIMHGRNEKSRKNLVNEVTRQERGIVKETRENEQLPIFFLHLVSMAYSRKVTSLTNNETLKCGFPR